MTDIMTKMIEEIIKNSNPNPKTDNHAEGQNG